MVIKPLSRSTCPWGHGFHLRNTSHMNMYSLKKEEVLSLLNQQLAGLKGEPSNKMVSRNR